MNSAAVTQPRILAPDVARGFTMLGIAIANATTAWLYISPDTPGSTAGVVDNSILDKIAIILGSIFTHVRGLPMFATLLGYGVGMITMSLQRRNYPPKKARLVLIRRYFFLAIFGILHLSLLFFGDIMFVYGIMGIILALLYRFKDKTLLIITGVLGTLGLILTAVMMIYISAGGGSSRTEVMISAMQTLSAPDSYATLVSHAFTALSFQIGNLLTGFLFFSGHGGCPPQCFGTTRKIQDTTHPLRYCRSHYFLRCGNSSWTRGNRRPARKHRAASPKP